MIRLTSVGFRIVRTGHEILLYLIMYRKYVRKWWLLKINRIIFPEVAVNGQFLPGKLNLFLNCMKKSKLFGDLPGKINFFVKLREKIEIFGKFEWKNRFFYPDPRPPRFQTRLMRTELLKLLVYWASWCQSSLAETKHKSQLGLIG